MLGKIQTSWFSNDYSFIYSQDVHFVSLGVFQVLSNTVSLESFRAMLVHGIFVVISLITWDRSLGCRRQCRSSSSAHRR